MKQTKITDIAEVAAGQWGLVTTGQAASVDVDARTLARLAHAGELERLTHGVYRIAGTPTSSQDELRAAWLSFDPSRTAAERLRTYPVEVVSHRSAAVTHQLGDLAADHLEFTTSVRRQTRRPDIRFHRIELSNEDWQLADGLPVTTPLKTIGDLAHDRIDQGHLAGAVRDAIVQHHVPADQIAAILSPHASAYDARDRDGDQLLSRLVRQSGVPRSALDLASLADPSVQRSLAVKLLHTGAFDGVMREHLRSLAVGRLLEQLVRALQDSDPDFLTAEKIRALVEGASLESDIDVKATQRRLLEILHRPDRAGS